MESLTRKGNLLARKKVVVIGFYGKGNIGDEAFKSAFTNLLPECDLSFVDYVPGDINVVYDAAIIGGGNVLDNDWLKLGGVAIPISFIGISASVISEGHRQAIEKSKITIVRDKTTQNNIASSILMPDLAFALPQPSDVVHKEDPHVIVLMNDHLRPRKGMAEYHTHAFNWFKHEFATCLDTVVNDYNLKIKFMCMSNNPKINDLASAQEIIKSMQRKDMVTFGLSTETVLGSLKSSRLVITQRYHGMIFATQQAHPFLAVSAHDKFRNYCDELPWSGYIDYYGFSKRGFLRALSDVAKENCGKLKKYSDNGRDSWTELSSTIKERLFG